MIEPGVPRLADLGPNWQSRCITLGRRAPELALACLEADNYADMMERGEQIRRAETAHLRKALREALAAADVEVP